MATHMPVTENTLISIKVAINDGNKKLKLPLKDLGVEKLIPKLRYLLCIDPAQEVVFERYSDSVGGYVVLDPSNPAVFKTLVRAAKAKLKLRLRANAPPPPPAQEKGEAKEEIKDKTNEMEHKSVLSRGSTAFDQRSVGPGIFKFRDPVSSVDEKTTVVETGEAPVPYAFSISGKDALVKPSTQGLEHELALRTKEGQRNMPWTVYCNECDAAMTDAHFHCSKCDDGDYDLCQSCVDSGKVCPGKSHWLIKRTVINGEFVTSTTERHEPKQRCKLVAAPVSAPAAVPAATVEDETTEDAAIDRDMPGTFADDTRTLHDDAEGAFRTCNNCIIGLPDQEFVTCTDCEDFDLCRRCYTDNKHGHHPAHQFEAAAANTKLTAAEKALLPAGRDVRHNAICDGCDKNIRGVRHKCFTCPDFDYCSTCVKRARHTHPRHSFAKIYEATSYTRGLVSVTHHGIYCDGPLCKNERAQLYIQGVRYKCVVCNDTDFCASCEALPTNPHNKTHPLIKFKTAVNNVSISTQNEMPDGTVKKLGDRATPAKLVNNVTTPVKTVADIKPSLRVAEKDESVVEASSPATPPTPLQKPEEPKKSIQSTALEAHFVRDTIADGTVMAPNTRFTQVWTLRNPGPRVWPAGCSVRFVGGDNMLNIDNMHPSSVSDINDATESNVVGREVQPGEEVAFKVLLKTSTREGKLISYWRVKAADGTPFGHKLWCDVDVKRVEEKAPKAVSEVLAAPDQSKMAEYWAGYQQRMSAIRLANARRQAEMLRAYGGQIPVHAVAAMNHSDAYQTQVDWRKQMEKFVRRTNASNTVQPAASDDGSKADMSVKTEIPSSQTGEVASVHDGKETKDSQMIFPTLERESPSSSTYESLGSAETDLGKTAFVEEEKADVKLAGGSPKPIRATDVAGVAEADEEQFEDISELEVLSADGEAESDDDGFMTDEEYDILDASDQETVASK